MRPIKAVKCTHVVAQVSLGYYDAEGNLVGEELFPQAEGGVLIAKLFHPHPEQLASLIETCVQQAWTKLSEQGLAHEQERLNEVSGNHNAPVAVGKLEE